MEAGKEYVFVLTRERQVAQFDQNTGQQILIPVPYDLVVATGKVKGTSQAGIVLEDGVTISPLGFTKAIPKALLEEQAEAAKTEPKAEPKTEAKKE